MATETEEGRQAGKKSSGRTSGRKRSGATGGGKTAAKAAQTTATKAAQTTAANTGTLVGDKRLGVDLKDLSKVELEELKASVDRHISEVNERNRTDALAEMQRIAESKGFRMEDLVQPAADAKGRQKGPKNQPKFRNPHDPSKTWSGRGRKPDWLKAHLSEGGSLEDLRI